LVVISTEKEVAMKKIFAPVPTTDEIDSELQALILAGQIAMERGRQGDEKAVEHFVIYAEPILEKAMRDLKIR
jgi:hypothetical protein